jgi:hypothetical protein
VQNVQQINDCLNDYQPAAVYLAVVGAADVRKGKQIKIISIPPFVQLAEYSILIIRMQRLPLLTQAASASRGVNV